MLLSCSNIPNVRERMLPNISKTEQLVARTLGDSFHKHFVSFSDATLVGLSRQAILLSLMEECGYDAAFMFKYSERPGTYASKHLEDNVPEVRNRE